MAEEKGYKIKSLEWQYKPPHNQIEYVDIENYSAKTPFGKISVYRARNSGEKKWNNWFIWLPQKQEVELLSGTTPKQAVVEAEIAWEKLYKQGLEVIE